MAKKKKPENILPPVKAFTAPSDQNIFSSANPEDVALLQHLMMVQPDFMMEIIGQMIEMQNQGLAEEEIIAKCEELLEKRIGNAMDPFELFAPRKRRAKKSVSRKPCNVNSALTLKIQLKGVTKPPCWRQIRVPAKFTFLQLHNIIQLLFGLDDGHLWMFQERVYDSDITIGVPINADGFGIDDATNNASRTKLNKFLTAEGDALEYVYDFGNDWIFTITVKKVDMEPCKHAVCENFKSPVQCLDFMGPWNYETLRELYFKREEMTRKQLSKAADELGMEDENLMGLLYDLDFDLDYINEELQDTPNSVLTF